MGFQGTSASNMPQMFVSLHLHWFHTAASNKWSSKDWNLCLWSWMFLAQKNKRFVSMESLRSLRSVALLMVNIWYMNMIERNLQESSLLQSRATTYLGKPGKCIANSFQSLACFDFGMCSNSVQQKLSYAAGRKVVECDGRNCVLFAGFNGRFREFRESSCALAALIAFGWISLELHWLGSRLASMWMFDDGWWFSGQKSSFVGCN